MELKGFIGGSYQTLGRTADLEHTINFYVSKLESQGATTPVVLYPTPGVSLLATHNAGVGRAHYQNNGREFAVIGADLVEIFADNTITVRGTVTLDDRPATICGNGDAGGELFVTSGRNGYVYDLAANTLSAIAALSGVADMGDMLSGYFLALDATTSTMYISDLLDGTTWQGSQIAQRSLAPDRWVSLKVSGRYIWLLGEFTSEVWYDAGSFPFPFAPYPIGIISWGCKAPFSVSVAGEAISWLAQNRGGSASVVAATGFTPAEISTVALSEQLGAYITIQDAIGDTYTEAGHTFYLITFVDQDITWAYDQNSQTWCQRGTWISEQNIYEAWRPRFHCAAFGQHRILDSQTGSVYEMSMALPLDVDDRPIRRLRRAPSIFDQNRRLFYGVFELFLDVGLKSLPSGFFNPEHGPAVLLPDHPPAVMLRQSDDGGLTWGPERDGSAGFLGEYTVRARWTRGGSGRRRVYEVSCSDPISWRITGAAVELQGAA